MEWINLALLGTGGRLFANMIINFLCHKLQFLDYLSNY
jgi:hypothetical protein